MHTVAKSIALSGLISAASAAVQGFNYGAQKGASGVKVEADYEREFMAAHELAGTDGQFTSARLYTMCQGDSTNAIEAIPAALRTNTTLLLGLWASAGDAGFDMQLKCLESAIKDYPDAASIIDGISIGSEDLYRASPTALENSKLEGAEPPVGAKADVITSYIKKTRDLIKGTEYADAKVGHVDTWSVWVDGANKPVIEACDWIGFDGYPYWESGNGNDISNAKKLFKESLDKTKAVAGGKPVWITETGWPVAGPSVDKAETGPENAQKYWQDVGCALFGETNTWWFTIQGESDPKKPNWGVLDAELNPEPAFGLSCKGVQSSLDDEESTSGTNSSTESGSGSGSDSSSSSDGSSSAPGGGNENGVGRSLNVGISTVVMAAAFCLAML